MSGELTPKPEDCEDNDYEPVFYTRDETPIVQLKGNELKVDGSLGLGDWSFLMDEIRRVTGQLHGAPGSSYKGDVDVTINLHGAFVTEVKEATVATPHKSEVDTGFVLRMDYADAVVTVRNRKIKIGAKKNG